MEGLYQKESRDDVTHRGMEGLYQKESRDEVTHRGMEGLYQRQELFCIESGCCLVAGGNRKGVMWADS